MYTHLYAIVRSGFVLYQDHNLDSDIGDDGDDDQLILLLFCES